MGIDHDWAVGMADNCRALACLVGDAGDWHRSPRADLERWRMVTNSAMRKCCKILVGRGEYRSHGA